MSVPVQTSLHARLSHDDLRPGLELARLLERAAVHDGHAPFGEHVLLTLDGRLTQEHARITVHSERGLAGFCVLSRSTEAWYAELVTDPDARCQGVGAALLLAARRHVASHGGGLLRCWGSQPGAPAALARKIGMTVLRSLHFQRRHLPVDPDPQSRPSPTGVRVRMLRGEEAEAWLTLSNAAFLGHPENGGWTMTDLHWRLAATWTDLTRFPVAVDSNDQLLAGVWTKAEPGAPDAELYVVAVHPRQGGRGVGELVVREALHALHAAGSTTATLYVDEANTRARALYDRVGFRTHHVDHCYQVDVARELS